MLHQSSRITCYFIALCLCCSVLLSCKQQKTAPDPPQSNNFLTLRIGLLPEHNIFTQKKRFEPLFKYLSTEVGLKLESSILPRYGNIIDNFNQLELDGAFFGSFTGAMAIETLDVEPVARPQYDNGSSTYFGMVFVKRNSGIRTAADMQNKRMVFVDRATTAGYLLPLAHFKNLGIDNYTSWFSEYYFSGTHEDAIYDVLMGRADIGAAKNTVFYRLAQTDPRLVNELEILATSPRVPANGLAIVKDLPQDIKQKMRAALLTMHLSKAGQKILADLQVERFINTTAEDYQPVLDYAKTVELNLSSYQYSND